VTKQDQFYKEVARLKTVLRKRDSEYLRFLLNRSGIGTVREAVTAAREILRERGENVDATRTGSFYPEK
jgi:hypothetical protein